MTETPAAPHGRVRRDIEGMRAVAVGAVLLFHAGVGVVPGGFVGVDVFFVISGFLITALLLREVARSGTVSISRFYARRARRLLPAATLVLLVTAVVGFAVLPGSGRGDLGRDVAAAALYVVNWALAARSVNYLAEGASMSPVQHYWSLSVEEQYYLVWPLLIIGLAALARRRGWLVRPILFGAVAVVFAVSLGWSVVHTSSSPATSYFITTTRIWELAIGSLVAFSVHRLAALPPRWAQLLAGVGIAMVAFSVFAFTAATTWPGIAALVPTVGTAMVIAAGCGAGVGGVGTTVVARALGWWPLVWLGGVSYAVYLWHWPLIVLSRARFPDLVGWQVLLIALLAVPLAWLTRRLVEDPVRFAPALTRRPSPALAMGLALMSVSVLAGSAVLSTVPELTRNTTALGARALVADPAAGTWRVAADASRHYDRSGRIFPDPAAATQDAPLRNGCQVGLGRPGLRTNCVYGKAGSATTIAMLGDSKMGQWFPAVRRVAVDEGWRLEVYLKSACVPAPIGVTADCAQYNARLLAWLKQHGAPDYVLVSVRGSSYERSSNGLAKQLAALQAMGSKVIVLADNLDPNTAVYECVEKHPHDFAACGFDREGQHNYSGNRTLDDAVRQLGLPKIDLERWICPPAKTCPAVIGGVLVYRQGSHVTATYMRTLTPMLHRALVRLGVARTPLRDIGLDDVPR